MHTRLFSVFLAGAILEVVVSSCGGSGGAGGANKADLVPVPDTRPGFGFCRLVESGPDKGKLKVFVKNQGSAAAPASITTIAFNPGGPIAVPTGPIGVGMTIELTLVNFPAPCFNPDCDFTICVDSGNAVDESDEANNCGNGNCLG